MTTLYPTQNSTWVVPADWNNAVNTIECIGRGADGVNQWGGACATYSEAGGGGGGAAGPNGNGVTGSVSTYTSVPSYTAGEWTDYGGNGGQGDNGSGGPGGVHSIGSNGTEWGSYGSGGGGAEGNSVDTISHTGGGGGAYTKCVNLTLTPGSSYYCAPGYGGVGGKTGSYDVWISDNNPEEPEAGHYESVPYNRNGQPGQDSFFGGNQYSNCIVGAKGGSGTVGATNPGGQAASARTTGSGYVTYSGGSSNSAAGGGAAGPTSNGGNSSGSTGGSAGTGAFNLINSAYLSSITVGAGGSQGSAGLSYGGGGSWNDNNYDVSGSIPPYPNTSINVPSYDGKPGAAGVIIITYGANIPAPSDQSTHMGVARNSIKAENSFLRASMKTWNSLS